MNGEVEEPLPLPGGTLKVCLLAGLESAAECVVWAVVALLAAAHGAVAAAAAARAAASGWDCMEAGGAPVPPFHCAPGEPASFPLHLQQQKDPAINHVLKSKQKLNRRGKVLGSSQKKPNIGFPGRPV